MTTLSSIIKTKRATRHLHQEYANINILIRYKDANICKGRLQTICLVIAKYLIGFLDWIL